LPLTIFSCGDRDCVGASDVGAGVVALFCLGFDTLCDIVFDALCDVEVDVDIETLFLPVFCMVVSVARLSDEPLLDEALSVETLSDERLSDEPLSAARADVWRLF
jgi:hypothetical protein